MHSNFNLKDMRYILTYFIVVENYGIQYEDS